MVGFLRLEIDVSDDELNQYLHEQVMGKCWHERDDKKSDSVNRWCRKCGTYLAYKGNPDPHAEPLIFYTRSLDSVAQVERKVIETGMGRVYQGELFIAMRRIIGIKVFGYDMLTAPARQRAEACKSAWELI